MMISRKVFTAFLVAFSAITALGQDKPTVPKVISVGVVNGKATNLVKPVYPPAAKAVNASGAVNVEVTISEDGSVVEATAVLGHPLLRTAAIEAAKASKFSPTLCAGMPVKVVGIIVFNFNLPSPAPAKRELSWFSLGYSLAAIANLRTTTSSGYATQIPNVPEDWADVRAMLARLEELRGGPRASGLYPESSTEAIAMANDISRIIALKLEDKPVEVWRFRLGRALLGAAATVTSPSDNDRRQAAFAIRELAFVTPPGVDVKTVDDLTLLSDLLETGNLSEDERKQFDGLDSKMQELFR